jgi:hypothetical protein
MMSREQAQWFFYERLITGSRLRESNVDPSHATEHLDAEPLVLIGALAVGCAILEKLGLRHSTVHTRVLFSVRNAVVHNEYDISKNRSASDLLDANNYLSAQKYKLLSPDVGPYFSLNGTKVKLEGQLYFAIRLMIT